jgi:hypothetical protein
MTSGDSLDLQSRRPEIELESNVESARSSQRLKGAESWSEASRRW